MKKIPLIISAYFLMLLPVMAVNIILNGSFEVDIQPTNGNNFPSSVTDWTLSAGIPNIVRPFVGIAEGPEAAQDGTQYLDITIAASVFQEFTITEASSVDFSGYFSRRQNSNVTSSLGIFSADGLTEIASVDVTNTNNDWTLGSGSISILAAGTYRINVTLANPANVDNISLNVISLPEPSSLALVAFGGIILLVRRCR